MATNINLDMVMRPTEVALANLDEALDRTADNVDQASYLPAGLREGLMAMVAAGKANIDGAKLIRQEVASYAEASIDARSQGRQSRDHGDIARRRRGRSARAPAGCDA